MHPSCWSGGAGWHKYAPLRTHDAKKGTAGLPKTNKLVQDTRKHKQTCMESAQKRPSAKKEPGIFMRGSKNTNGHHNRAAGAPKTEDGPQKKHERSNSRLPTKKHGNTQQVHEYVDPHYLQMGGFPQSFLYISLLVFIDLWLRRLIIPCLSGS